MWSIDYMLRTTLSKKSISISKMCDFLKRMLEGYIPKNPKSLQLSKLNSFKMKSLTDKDCTGFENNRSIQKERIKKFKNVLHCHWCVNEFTKHSM